MIIEIALGIVLAVLILTFLDWILALGLLAIVVAIAIAVIAAAFHFARSEPEIFFTILALVVVFVGYAVWENKRNAKHTAAKRAEAQLSDRADGEPTP